MKKLVSGIVLGAILVTGFFFAVDVQPDHLAVNGERHPPIFIPTDFDSGLDF